MSFGPIKLFNCTIASGASTGTFTLDKAYTRVYVHIPTMSTGTGMNVFQSVDGTSYYPSYERVNTAPVQYQTLDISSGVGGGGGIVPLDVQGPYVQLRASAVVSGGVAMKIICAD